MPIVRTYLCHSCERTFEVTLDSGSAPDSDCPYCEKVMQWQPGMFAIKTNKSRALDVTQEIVENDYGLSNLKDNLREGDVAAMTPVKTTADREADEALQRDLRDLATNSERMHPAARTFFGGAQGGPFGQNLNVQSVIQNAKGSVPADRNPMAMLSEAGKRGQLPINYKLLAANGQTINVRK